MLEKDVLKKLQDQVNDIVKVIGDDIASRQDEAKVAVEKGLGDVATDLDIESERRLVEDLGNLEKEFPVYGEEEHAKPDAEIYWVVDPIDGTKNFVRGLPVWSINVALFDASTNEVLLGVVYFPKFGDMFAASKGNGSIKNGKSIKPSTVNQLEDAYVYAEMPNPVGSAEMFDGFNELLRSSRRVRGWGLAAALCYTADGAFDAHYDFSGTTKPYDIYASLVIAQEAGCKVEGFENGEINSVLKVTNGTLNS